MPDPAWSDALRVAALVAADPHGLGGVVVRAGAGPVRERWLAALRARLPPETPWRRMPAGIADDRLIGGLDLPATLRAGHPVAQAGLLAEADGGLIVVPMAERLAAGTVARLAAALDTGAVALEREGSSARLPARIGLILLDEGGAEESVAEALADRLAFRIDLDGLRLADLAGGPSGATGDGDHAESVGAGPSALSSPPAPAVAEKPADAAAILCETALALGIASLRAPLLALHVVRLVGGDAPVEADLAEAARLVLAPRATRLASEPASEPEAEGSEADAGEEAPPPPPADPGTGPDESVGEAAETVLDAARAAIPKNLLAQLLAEGPRLRSAKAGRMGAAASAPRSGRPVGSRKGDPRRALLDLIATLRAAAPWQRLRKGPEETRRIVVLPDDLRIRVLRQKSETTTIFCVDASGSAALERLGEAKGAVELMLAEAYIRRDRVALVAFRGRGAEVVLPPTRSLVRAKRSLSGLPGGGGTPLAAGLDAATSLALAVRRAGGHPVIVLLTDGRANVARSGEGGRARASEDALAAARGLRAQALPLLVIDTGARPDGARRLAETAAARYCPMPNADSGALTAAVRAAAS
ncbi:magnesium chelatase subunit D [Methylobacterium organophilum]|uniref:Magnesium-chelatase 60 kDa subunit n=1 Tax=Methylobacterium organophilum TaxID=410 RepID=A0ABQ4TD05_METOR|nr:magnesium chelatase subunit D [Methylobacterium organophilum]GJE28549.1 Magnesium-chelatase 60 kDa subunit [Methylobacterium organophilum]